MELMQDPKIAAGTRAGQVGEMYKHSLGKAQDMAASKEPSEMTYDELTASIDTLRREQEARADQARDVTPEQVSAPDASTVFD